jgi:hypothetical protein
LCSSSTRFCSFLCVRTFLKPLTAVPKQAQGHFGQPLHLPHCCANIISGWRRPNWLSHWLRCHCCFPSLLVACFVHGWFLLFHNELTDVFSGCCAKLFCCTRHSCSCLWVRWHDGSFRF